MSGKGKGKGFGKAKHRSKEKDVLTGITKPAIRRLARRGGVKRISSTIYPQTREVLKAFLDVVIRDSLIYTDHAQRKTVTSSGRHVYALKETRQDPCMVSNLE
ncbi:Histone_H4 [Hexamita inflata]|uniref:Histone H4 n=1 Tax=Hexamita inflata TaxID=28002 RepID=A0AA86R037_9EUKA|nr:Histone H4 [Hexamita inflata]